MAKSSSTGPDLARAIAAGALAANNAIAQGGPFFAGLVNVSVWGTFVGTVVLEKSYDGGTTWFILDSDLNGTDLTFTAERHIQIEEAESGMLYRWRVTAYTSGTINVRASQG